MPGAEGRAMQAQGTAGAKKSPGLQGWCGGHQFDLLEEEKAGVTNNAARGARSPQGRGMDVFGR